MIICQEVDFMFLLLLLDLFKEHVLLVHAIVCTNFFFPVQANVSYVDNMKVDFISLRMNQRKYYKK